MTYSNSMPKKYPSKQSAEKHCHDGFATVWRGPAISDNPGWYNVSRIRGKRH